MADWMAKVSLFLMIPLVPGILLLLVGLGVFENEKVKEFVIAGGVATGLGVVGLIIAASKQYEIMVDEGMFNRKISQSNSVQIVELPMPISAVSLGGPDPRTEKWKPTEYISPGVIVNRKSRKSRKSRKNRKTVA